MQGEYTSLHSLVMKYADDIVYKVQQARNQRTASEMILSV